MTPIVSWVTNITLDHVAQPQLDLNGQEAVMATAAYSPEGAACLAAP